MAHKVIVGGKHLEVKHSAQVLPWVLLRYLYDEPTCIRLLDSRWSKAVEPVTKRVGYLSGKIR